MPFRKVLRTENLDLRKKINTQNSLLRSHPSKVKHGFTLIELLVVISIIAILIGIATVSYTSAQKKSRDARRKTDLKAIQLALEEYYDSTGEYPPYYYTPEGRLMCDLPFEWSVINWGSTFSCWPEDEYGTGIETVFMEKMPTDPIYSATSGSGYYYYPGGGQTYKISAKLENTNDPEYCVSTGTNCVTSGKLPCEPRTGRNYCVINP